MATAKMRIFSTVDDIYKALDEGVSIHQKFSYSHPTKTKGKSIRLSLGRIWFNLLQPADLPLYDQPITAKDISSILKIVVDSKTPKEASEYLTRLNQETFKMSSYIPTSFESKGFVQSEEIKEKKEQLKKETGLTPQEYMDRISAIENEYQKDLQDGGFRLDNIRVSGAKPVPWNQLMVAQGYAGDIEGNINGPIKNAIVDGYSIEEYYHAAAEARNGFYYKAAISSKPGYLSRKVTMANANIVLDDSKMDCGTSGVFKLQVDKEIAGLIKDRYIQGSNGKLKLINDPSEYIGKTINLRSPLYCKSEQGICPTCYGKSWEVLENKNLGV